jgi:hypothetical protein
MHRFLSLLIFYVICFAGIAAGIPRSADFSGNAPDSNTPQKLQEAWLRFHETDLCQEVDAVFLFNKSGMEVWSRIESDKINQKFQELFDTLSDSMRIELYTTRPPAKKRSDNADDPPPSLCQNLELRSNLGDPVGQFREHLDFEERIHLDSDPPDSLLKQRLLVYAERTLDWNRKMGKYAADLSALVRFALDPAVAPELKSKSIRICTVHAQNLEKHIGKLAKDLALAFPKPSKGDRSSSPRDTSNIAGKTLMDSAEQISASTRIVARRVHQFIHPEGYTIGLDELRHPGLLESLKTLRGMVLDFQRAMAKPMQNNRK